MNSLDSESKRIKQPILEESFKGPTVLSQEIKTMMQNGVENGFDEDRIDLCDQNIDAGMMLELCEWFIRLGSRLKEVNLEGNKLTSKGAIIMFDSLRRNDSTIKMIYLCNNQLDDECMESLGEYIKANKSLDGIDLAGNHITDNGIETLVPHLQGNSTLTYISLDRNKGITDECIPYLCKMIDFSQIEDVGIDETSITRKNALVVSYAHNAFKYGSRLLDLRECGVNDEDIIKICTGIKKHGVDKLEDLNLGINEITSTGATMLFDVLKSCNSEIKTLNLHCNQIDDECMYQCGEYVKNNQTLECLNLDTNMITDKGIKILTDSIVGNLPLKQLSLNENVGITNVSVSYFLDIAKRSYISIINILDTSISSDRQQQINNLLSIPIDEREFSIKNSNLGASASSSTYSS